MKASYFVLRRLALALAFASFSWACFIYVARLNLKADALLEPDTAILRISGNNLTVSGLKVTNTLVYIYGTNLDVSNLVIDSGTLRIHQRLATTNDLNGGSRFNHCYIYAKQGFSCLSLKTL